MTTTFIRTVMGTVFLGAACFAAQGQEMSRITCAAGGQIYDVGDVACIPACHGQQQLAKCEQAGAGASWTSISNSCPSALIKTPRQSFRAASADISPRAADFVLR